MPAHARPAPAAGAAGGGGLDGVGVACGLASVLIWATYNIASSIGMSGGFRALDLTLLRFATPGFVLVPFVLHRALRSGGGGAMGALGWTRALWLALAGGPVFGVLVYSGFQFAPLAHGVVVAPAAGMLTGMLLGQRFGGERLAGSQWAGAAVMVAGLLFLASEGLSGTRHDLWIGDLIWAASGVMWGVFTFLLKRWQVSPSDAVAAVGIPSILIFLPIYLAATGGTLPPVSGAAIAAQVFFQGVLGGLLGILAYGVTVRRLGAGRAAVFPSFTPAVATVLAVPVLGEVPTVPELIGMALAAAGLLMALGGRTCGARAG